MIKCFSVAQILMLPHALSVLRSSWMCYVFLDCEVNAVGWMRIAMNENKKVG